MSDKGELGIEYKILQISDVLSKLYIETLLANRLQTWHIGTP